MKFLEPLLNLFRKRVPAVTPAEAENAKEPVLSSRNTTIWVIVVALVLTVAVGAGSWWWKARHKTVAPANVVHAPAKPIVNASPLMPVHEEPVTPAVTPLQDMQAASAVTTSKPAAEGIIHEVETHQTATTNSHVVHEEKTKPAHSSTVSITASDTQIKLPVSKEVVLPDTAKPVVKEKKKIRTKVTQLSEESPMLSQAEVAPMPDTTDQTSSVDKRLKPVTVQQQADNEFRKGVSAMQQGHISDALRFYEAALKLDVGHEDARQAMVALLLEDKRIDDAERVLREGVKANPKHSMFAMLLARLQIERGTPWSALLTLQEGLPYAKQQADYQAFMAALLQRLEHHQEAVAHYRAALQATPNSGLWLMGLGMSLQALHRTDEARDAFQRASDAHNLNADLQEFVTQRLKEM